MTEKDHNSYQSSIINRSHHCIKANCNRLLPWNHPTTYTNGLCERHFFSIDILLNDDKENSNCDIKNSNNMMYHEKLSSKEKHIYSTSTQFTPLRGNIRKTREIFDGYQWCLIEQTIDYADSTAKTDNSNLRTTNNNNQETFLETLRLLIHEQLTQDACKNQQ